MKKIIGVLIIISCYFIIMYIQPNGKTIEEITGVNFANISYIKTGGGVRQNENYSVDKFVQEYKDMKYKKINGGSAGNTAHQYYVCYGSNNEILFTYVDIGNNNKVCIKKGDFDINRDLNASLYQKQ